MAHADSWTIKRLLEWTTSHLNQAGSESARLDAEVLLAHARDCRRIELYANFDEVPRESVLARFREAVRQRAAGKPVAYLVGHREFFSMEFEVNPDVLIPRPETEFLVLECLDRLAALVADGVARPRVADIGTGCGCIAVALARHQDGARIWASDISAEALRTAERNALRHHQRDRITFLQSDLLERFPAELEFDLIASNPPYVGETERGALAADVVDHEPAIALFAGPAGMTVIDRLIGAAGDRLRAGGSLLMEISPRLAEACREALQADGRYAEVGFREDLDRLKRIVTARRRG